MLKVKRSEENPIIVPDSEILWESEGAFNGCPYKKGNKTGILYRAASSPMAVDGIRFSISSIGHATSQDGIHFKKTGQLIKPEREWEKFGCEDPRVTKLGGKYYIFYTALSKYPFSADGIKIGLAITKDFKKIDTRYPVTTFNSKAMALFPEKINGKFAAVLTANTDLPPSKIGIALFDKEENMWSPEYWSVWYKNLENNSIFPQRTPYDHVEIGAPPLKTRHGWLLIYSYIQNYMRPPATFGVEAILLDLKNPMKIIAKTDSPILMPREEYERYGKVPNVIFPSGALIKNRRLLIYYGSADTSCAVASLNLSDLIVEMFLGKTRSLKLKRHHRNPIILPDPKHPWESKAVFNAGVIYLNNKMHIVYRAMSEDNTSVWGYASSKNGFTMDYRSDNPIYVPSEDFEKKNVPGGNSGCEDPRLTKIGDKIYACYTAFNGRDRPRVALTSIFVKDFLAKNWSWTKPVLISSPDTDDKDAAIFPKKIKGKYAILHRPDNKNIWIDFVDSLNFDWKAWIKGKILMEPRTGERDSVKIGIAGPPIETTVGWLLIYHGISKKENRHYHLRVAILDLKDPAKIVARTKDAILEPEMLFEKEGITPNVVFSCGAALIEDKLFVYYGAADKVLGIATIKLSDLFDKFAAEKICESKTM